LRSQRSGEKAHTTRSAGFRRDTNRAGGIEAGISNGEEIVVRAGMKPLPTLMRPLASVDLDTGEPAEALVERSDVAAVEALAVVAEAAVAFELARAALEKFGGDAVGDFVAAWRAYLDRIPWRRTPRSAPRPRPVHAGGRDVTGRRSPTRRAARRRSRNRKTEGRSQRPRERGRPVREMRRSCLDDRPSRNRP
jgi:hypothetical protein